MGGFPGFPSYRHRMKKFFPGVPKDRKICTLRHHVLVALVSFAGIWMPIRAAGIAGIPTLNSGQSFNFDNSHVLSSGGDITFTGTSITFQGTAKGFNYGVVPSSVFASINQDLAPVLQQKASTDPLPVSELTDGDVVVLFTNGGNVAKLLITMSSSNSISFEFMDYGTIIGTGDGPNPPTIASILNNSSEIPAGFANSGIAPSTIFKVHGTGMAPPGTTPVLQTPTATTPIPATLNGTSLSVAVNGTTVNPAIYYSSPTDIAAELPANTPIGTGYLTVSNNGSNATAPITVVASAFGIDAYNGNYGVVQDSVTGAIITPINSAKPGETVTLWGTGLGADPGDSDVNYSSSPHAINAQVEVYLGTLQVPAANILFVGSLGYPGVNGVIFTVPNNAPSGCFVSIAVVTGGSTVSNVPTASFMPNGGVCSDAYTGVTGTQISTLTGQTTVNSRA